MIQILVILVLLAVLLYVVTFLPIDSTLKNIIKVAAIATAAIWIVRIFFPSFLRWGPILKW